MGEFLLVTIQVDMHDRLAMTLQDDLTDAIVKHRARGVLIDISALEIVDSFIGRDARRTSPRMARVLDAETVVVGMRPAVAITLVELGLRCPGCARRSTSSGAWRCSGGLWAHPGGTTVAVLREETLAIRSDGRCRVACGR